MKFALVINTIHAATVIFTALHSSKAKKDINSEINLPIKSGWGQTTLSAPTRKSGARAPLSPWFYVWPSSLASSVCQPVLSQSSVLFTQTSKWSRMSALTASIFNTVLTSPVFQRNVCI